MSNTLTAVLVASLQLAHLATESLGRFSGRTSRSPGLAQEAPGSDQVALPREGRVDPRALWTLLIGNGLTSMGVSFFLPILPLYIASKGASSLLVGLVFAAGVCGRALVQYPAGWLSDRYGRRPLLVGGLLVYALFFPIYLVGLPPAALIAVRFLHALAGGSVSIVATALMADLTQSEGRGKAFGWLRASDMAGVLLGPALGGLVAGIRLDAVFVGAALVCLLAVPLMLRLPAPPPGSQRREGGEPDISAWKSLRPLLPVVLLGASFAEAWHGLEALIASLSETERGAVLGGTLRAGKAAAAAADADEIESLSRHCELHPERRQSRNDILGGQSTAE